MTDLGFRLVGAAPKATGSVSLVCFPHAGGSPTPYLGLAHYLPDDWGIQCVRYTRSGTPPSEIVTALAIELLGDPEVPRAFFGHSMGGSIAYQVVLRAKELGGSHLEHLILSSCAPPCLSQVDSRPYSASDFWLLLYDMIYLGGVPRRLAEDEALLRFAVEAYRRDLEFLEGAARLRWGPIDAPVSYFGGRDDRSLPRRPEDLWSAVVQRPVEASSFDGGHFFFVGAEAELCAALRRLVATGTRA